MKSLGEKKTKGIPLILKITFIMLIFIIAWITVPNIRSYFNGSISKSIFFFFGVSSLLCASIYSPRWLNEYIKYYLLPFTLFIVIVLGHYLFNNYDGSLLNLVDYFLVQLFIGIGLFIFKLKNKQFEKWILIIFIIGFTITSITTFSNLKINMNYSRLLTSSSTSEEITRMLERKNIGGFDFIYGITISIPAIIILLRNQFKLRYKAVLLINILLGSLCVIFANFTIAYLIFSLNVLVILIPYNNIKSIKFIRIFFCYILAILLIGRPLVTYMLKVILDYTPSLLTKEKIVSLISFLDGKISVYDVTSRTELLLNSVKCILKNPLFGVGAYYNSFQIVGGHNQLIDEVARYGVFGFIFIFLPIIIYVKTIIRNLEKNWSKNAYIISFIFYLILGCMNPMFGYFITLLIFVILPILIRYFDERE